MPDYGAETHTHDRRGTGSRLAAWAPQALSLLRIVAALIFLLHGTQKLLGFPPFAEGTSAPEAFTLSWTAGTIELVTGALMLLGLFTRPAAFLASGTMAFAYFIAHAPRELYPVLNNGDAAILYCFVFFYLIFAGPGPWSLDALLRRRS
ncbi:MAG TPA: DoxX family protein [Falsiroseomonas sp.]|jgi:putative oxidoreductase|nr:DoxX family protein [Falsiroseomonas sp.]